MAQIPGMLGEVFWGDPSKPLPNWREHPRPDGDEDDDDDRPLTDEERAHLTGLLGVDTNDLAKRFGADSSASIEKLDKALKGGEAKQTAARGKGKAGKVK